MGSDDALNKFADLQARWDVADHILHSISVGVRKRKVGATLVVTWGLLLPISVLADRYGVCDDCGGGGDDIFSLFLGAAVILGILVHISPAQRVAYLSVWLGGAASLYLFGLDTLARIWVVFGMFLSFPVAFWVVDKFGLGSKLQSANLATHDSAMPEPTPEHRTIKNKNEKSREQNQQSTQASLRNPTTISETNISAFTEGKIVGSMRDEQQSDENDRAFAIAGNGYSEPVSVEAPSPAIGPKKLLETIGIVTADGNMVPMLDAFSWLPIATTNTVVVPGGSELERFVLRLARRKGVFPGHVTYLGAFVISGFAKPAGDSPRIEIRISASKAGIEIQARDAAGSRIQIEKRKGQVESFRRVAPNFS